MSKCVKFPAAGQQRILIAAHLSRRGLGHAGSLPDPVPTYAGLVCRGLRDASSPEDLLGYRQSRYLRNGQPPYPRVPEAGLSHANDRGKSDDRAVLLWMAECRPQRTISAHGHAGDHRLLPLIEMWNQFFRMQGSSSGQVGTVSMAVNAIDIAAPAAVGHHHNGTCFAVNFPGESGGASRCGPSHDRAADTKPR